MLNKNVALLYKHFIIYLLALTCTLATRPTTHHTNNKQRPKKQKTQKHTKLFLTATLLIPITSLILLTRNNTSTQNQTPRHIETTSLTNYTQQEKKQLVKGICFPLEKADVIKIKEILNKKCGGVQAIAEMIYSFCKEHYIFQKVSINLYTNNPKSIIYFINETKSNIELKKEVNNDNNRLPYRPTT